MRTPKSGERRDVLSAIWTARSETAIAGLLWAGVAVAAVHSRATYFVLGLIAWQGAVYATAPFMSWLNTRTRLSDQLEHRRRTEWMRERFNALAPYLVGAAATVVALALIGALIGFGGSHPGPGARNPFVIPTSKATNPAPSPSAPVSSTPSLSPSFSPSPSPSFSPSPSPSPSP